MELHFHSIETPISTVLVNPLPKYYSVVISDCNILKGGLNKKLNIRYIRLLAPFIPLYLIPPMGI